ncbi:TPA: ribosome recycling factor [Candidatus Beckwithbacteria bacterium]|uniref:Ribosome-recycling factor n=3 Tax=Candidatus Azamiibacteriota TaxID=1752741 RepID=A0A0G0ZCX8_9BACT|nr:MAG: Ribosome recycling factor [Candidatus Azambacteria bacterium GW2011_GWB1_42_17]KKS46580.1 MAG: Ribosome recycling factor [Candidatus Azambacteria bacterium GW2011_GWA1_42_19]KKS75545.1 MAG: Ribosome recycling factor [Candidatus Azambacteria bacterium GW2011_GWA2_42_9]KKS88886.1 MAG: Ribosome recycling factor [Parcubacteria group bacterium GW2011_GWC1_43_11]HAF64294.1 ribosome recycling factor [Candidatus Beckwithbacteria bacterium]
MNILEKFKNNLKKTEESFKSELGSLRVGRATPALIENITVDYYGVKTPLKQIASISVPESRILAVEPWDKNALQAIEKAILTSDLGLSPIVDKNLIRINIPQLTEERRNSLIKIISSKLEEAKIKSRGSRDEIMKEISDSFSARTMTEDERFKMKEKVQQAIDETNKILEGLAKSKEKEIKET